MKTVRSPSRRSFLAQVAGGGLAAGAVLILGTRAAPAQQQTRRMVIDTDPRDPARMPPPPPPPPRARVGNGRAAASPAPAPAPNQRFIICPGNTRCPGNR